MSEKPLVLVTGGSGFLATWVIVYLLRQDYRVRTTVRSLKRAEEVKQQLREAEISEEQISSLDIVEADLLKDDGWSAAMKDVTYVQHVASPFPSSEPKHEDELIKPARDGTLRVLRHARDAGSVTRVVLTSSCSAIEVGHNYKSGELRSFTEDQWSDTNSSTIPAYAKSKTLAERAAWDFVEKEADGKLELAAINPVLIMGPALGADSSTSLRTVVELLEGNAPGLPHVNFGIVDVRDTANMHVIAMTHPSANGKRFLCIGEGCTSLVDIGKMLKKNLGPKARKVPSIVLPDFLVRVIAIFLPIARLVLPDLNVKKEYSNARAKEVLGWNWKYSTEQAIIASAESLIKYNAVKI